MYEIRCLQNSQEQISLFKTHIDVNIMFTNHEKIIL